jgi:hypothetical protein
MTLARHQNYEVTRILLASPSDVAEERNCASEVIDSVNKHFAMPLGIIIELRRWEDVSHPCMS